MIFTSQQVRAILAGRKRQFRIPRALEHECPYDVGHSYAAQRHRGEEESERIRVTAVREQLLHELTEEEARLEGFNSRADFMAAWWDKYRGGCGPGPPTMPWIEVPVWVVEIEPDREHRPRLMSSSLIAGKRGPYTNNPREALDTEAGEAIDPETQKRFTEDARAKEQRERERRRAENELRRLSERLADLEDAAAQGKDVARDLGRIRQGIEVAEKKLRRREAA